MITVEPTIRHGLAARDRRLLPDDEYAVRVLALQESLAADGLEGAVVFGHQSGGTGLTYLTALVPSMGFSAVVVPSSGEPTLVSASGPREVRFLRTQTWVSDIRTSRSLLDDAIAGVADVAGERFAAGARLGVVDAESCLDARSYARFENAFAGYELDGGTAVLDRLRRQKRPREVAAVGRAAACARIAFEAGAAVRRDGGTAAAAAVEIDRQARAAGGHDVRVLLGTDALGPSRTAARVPNDAPLSVYCAVEWGGYWGEALGTVGGDPGPAVRAVEAMCGRVRPGEEVAHVAAAARTELGDAFDGAAAYGLGGGIGCGLHDVPRLRTDSTDKLRPGDLLALRVIAPGAAGLACAGALLVLSESGANPV